jgi:hypothetical protein
MGLDVSHDCWHGAYSAFMRWRGKLAEVAGLPPLDLMEGFYPGLIDVLKYVSPPFDDVVEQWRKSLPIRWEALKPDVLHILLYHSDCDGDIPTEYCDLLADRLEELLPLLPTEQDYGHIGDWQKKTRKFIDGLRLAAKNGEPVEFY